MKKITSYGLWTLIVLSYLWVLIARRLGYPLPEFFGSYWGDLLCMPILMFSTVLIIRWVKRNPGLVLNKWQILFVLIYVSIMFEWILPSYSQQYVRDPWDVVCYTIGATVFWCIQPWILSGPKAQHT